MKEALYYEPLSDQKVKCHLCPFNCTIAPDKKGICGVRVNKEGKLYSEIYNIVSGLSMDPIEKKPLFHFYPGSQILSIGTVGCNFHCQFCQNWQISQEFNSPERDVQEISQNYLLELAQKNQSLGIAYTYSEPSIWIETVLETAKLFKKNNLKNVIVSNGFFEQAPLKELSPHIDAWNIDVKAFKEEFYKSYCAGRLQPVLDTVKYLYDKTHIELTMLVITGLNDNMADIEKFCDWVVSMDRSIPVHFSRYYPQYKMDIPATPEKTLLEIHEFAKKRLDHVYLGNVHIPDVDSTYCPHCKKKLIDRHFYRISMDNLNKDKCSGCGNKVPRMVV